MKVNAFLRFMTKRVSEFNKMKVNSNNCFLVENNLTSITLANLSNISFNNKESKVKM